MGTGWERKEKEYQKERGRGPGLVVLGMLVPAPGWADWTYPVILHRAMPVAGPIEEDVPCFFIEFESQGGLLGLQGFLDSCLYGTETAVNGRKDFQMSTGLTGEILTTRFYPSSHPPDVELSSALTGLVRSL